MVNEKLLSSFWFKNIESSILLVKFFAYFIGETLFCIIDNVVAGLINVVNALVTLLNKNKVVGFVELFKEIIDELFIISFRILNSVEVVVKWLLKKSEFCNLGCNESCVRLLLFSLVIKILELLFWSLLNISLWIVEGVFNVLFINNDLVVA